MKTTLARSAKTAKVAKSETAKTVGRPLLKFRLPSTGTFTVKTILGRLKSSRKPPTLVTVHNHIKRALAAGTIEQIGTRSEGRGRPIFVFRAKAAK